MLNKADIDVDSKLQMCADREDPEFCVLRTHLVTLPNAVFEDQHFLCRTLLLRDGFWS